MKQSIIKHQKMLLSFIAFILGLSLSRLPQIIRTGVFWFMLAYGIYVIYDAIQIQKTIKDKSNKKA
ncbi:MULTISPECIES: hypothetical protein [Erysipelothrix]|uniref:Uncharacterized protein n=1 Tax=Erysipelothrix piscisicarius TaxID=2485784 RepID=A0A3Q8S308_9FIRM|nr:MULTISPECIES: hypothetical protein [Erysipelothrix]AZK44489.1 hypothetical protein EEI45_06895 [Erysipelothrix piscisicarius]MBK2401779.1 hypothetical protein [Erysipelothrix sp. strain 2 (EsS2-6-Brazil)]NBA00867.1 hypothetical protein [Erysipelothrix rhusiopathiae]